MKKLIIAIASAIALSSFAITASAQHGGGGGGGWHGGGGGGGWHGGGGGGWHGGGDWHGHGGDGHSHFGFSIGFPFYWPYYGYYPYGYYPYGYGYPYYPYYGGYSSYYDSGAPQVYIQRDTGDSIAPSGPPQSQYSYYCTDPAGYYPQVANCPSGWLTVVPNGSAQPAPH